MKDYYQILRVKNTVGKSELQKSYRTLARQYHPDANGNDPKYHQILADINEAYEVLKDDVKRKAYDQKRSGEKEYQASKEPTSHKQSATYPKKEFDFANANKTFEEFFGFHGQADKNNKKSNPLDTTQIFEQFMGMKNK